MNKKELAKLLLKHPLIKQIKESKGIDKKDFNRILAEEIMNEADNIPSGDEALKKAFEINIDELKNEDLKTALRIFSRAKAALIQATGGSLDQASKEDFDELTIKIEQVRAKIEDMAKVSDKTETPKDDEITATAATSVATGLEQAAKGGTPESITQAVNDAEKTINKAANGVKQVASGEQGETQDNQQAGEKPTSTAVTTQGWSNAKKAADAKISQGATLEQIRDSLKDLNSFKKFWNVRGGEEEKIKQARELFEGGYFNDLLKKVSQEAKQENSEEKVKEEVTNLVATYQAFMDFLLNPKIDIDAQRLASTIGQAKQQSEPPKTEEEFNKQFTEPIFGTGMTDMNDKKRIRELFKQAALRLIKELPDDLKNL